MLGMDNLGKIKEIPKETVERQQKEMLEAIKEIKKLKKSGKLVEKDEECDFCNLAVAVGTSLRVCRAIGNKKKCKELEKKILNEEITPKQFFRTVRKLAKGHKKELEMLDMVDDFMEEAKHGKPKGKKKRRIKRR